MNINRKSSLHTLIKRNKVEQQFSSGMSSENSRVFIALRSIAPMSSTSRLQGKSGLQDCCDNTPGVRRVPELRQVNSYRCE